MALGLAWVCWSVWPRYQWWPTATYDIEMVVGDDWIKVYPDQYSIPEADEAKGKYRMGVQVVVEQPVPQMLSRRKRRVYNSTHNSPSMEALQQARPERGVKVRVSGYALGVAGYEHWEWRTGGVVKAPMAGIDPGRLLPQDVVDRVLAEAEAQTLYLSGDAELAAIVRAGGKARPELPAGVWIYEGR